MFADITIENLAIQRFSHREFSMGLGPGNGFAIGEALFFYFSLHYQILKLFSLLLYYYCDRYCIHVFTVLPCGLNN